MIRIIDTKGTGKTKKLLDAANHTGGIIVCLNPYALAEKARAYGYEMADCEFVSVASFLAHDYDVRHVLVYFDELEEIVKHIFFNKTLAGYTLSIDSLIDNF